MVKKIENQNEFSKQLLELAAKYSEKLSTPEIIGGFETVKFAMFYYNGQKGCTGDESSNTLY